jgi:hypothetical protein
MSELHYYFPCVAVQAQTLNVDVCAYGTSPGAIVAAIQARRLGHTVALIINGARVGGLTAGGLSNTDIGNKQSIGGLAREFYQRVGAHYGVAEEWRFEPHVAETVFHTLMREAGITPYLREFPKAVTMEGRRIAEVCFESGLVVRATQFIDASYEGDLLALAGVSYTVGREGNAEFGELLNGVQVRETHQFETVVDPYVVEGLPQSGLLPGINPVPVAPQGAGDALIQAYNFRLCLTQARDRRPFPRPDHFDPRDYELLARYLRTGWCDVFRKFDRIRGDKSDTNNHGAVSTDFIGGSWRFPTASWQEREEIFQAHVRWQQGLLWFLSHDASVPAAVRTEMASWGLTSDEFVATHGWPHQLYIREARRLRSDYVVTERDCRGYVRADDPVGLGAYAMDSHNCQRVVVNGAVRNEGDVQSAGFSPYPIAYRAITPRRGEAENLLVPTCVSATHIAYGSIRMEPVFMVLGQSAALAAHLAITRAEPVQSLPYSELRQLLDAANQVTHWPTLEEARSTARYEYEPEAPPPDDRPAKVSLLTKT